MSQLTIFSEAIPPRIACSQPYPELRGTMTVRQLAEAANLQGKQLIRFEAQPWRKAWLIKLHNAKGGGGWGYMHYFENEQQARDKLQELLGSGNYMEG